MQDGSLTEETAKPLPAEVIVTTMEALLLEGLEPPQNRQRGGDFRAVEYGQAEDPELEKPCRDFCKKVAYPAADVP